MSLPQLLVQYAVCGRLGDLGASRKTAGVVCRNQPAPAGPRHRWFLLRPSVWVSLFSPSDTSYLSSGCSIRAWLVGILMGSTLRCSAQRPVQPESRTPIWARCVSAHRQALVFLLAPMRERDSGRLLKAFSTAARYSRTDYVALK